MTVSPVKSQFIRPLLGVFRKTPGTDENGYFQLLNDKLSRFSPEDLAAAAEQIALEAEKQTWPMLKDCITACETAKARRLAAEKTQERPAQTNPDAGMPEEAAMRILAAEAPSLAAEACDGDWIVNLVRFVQAQKRIPDGREISDLRSEKTRIDARIEEQVACAQGRGDLSGHFVNLMIDGIHKRRASTAARMNELLQAA